MDPILPPPPEVAGAPARHMRLSFTVLFVMALGLAFYVMWPFRAPLFLAAVLASVLQGPYRWLCRLLRGRRGAAGVVTTVGLLVLLVGPLAAIVAFAASQLAKGLSFVHDE